MASARIGAACRERRAATAEARRGATASRSLRPPMADPPRRCCRPDGAASTPEPAAGGVGGATCRLRLAGWPDDALPTGIAASGLMLDEPRAPAIACAAAPLLAYRRGGCDHSRRVASTTLPTACAGLLLGSAICLHLAGTRGSPTEGRRVAQSGTAGAVGCADRRRLCRPASSRSALRAHPLSSACDFARSSPRYACDAGGAQPSRRARRRSGVPADRPDRRHPPLDRPRRSRRPGESSMIAQSRDRPRRAARRHGDRDRARACRARHARGRCRSGRRNRRAGRDGRDAPAIHRVVLDEAIALRQIGAEERGRTRPHQPPRRALGQHPRVLRAARVVRSRREAAADPPLDRGAEVAASGPDIIAQRLRRRVVGWPSSVSSSASWRLPAIFALSSTPSKSKISASRFIRSPNSAVPTRTCGRAEHHRGLDSRPTCPC